MDLAARGMGHELRERFGEPISQAAGMRMHFENLAWLLQHVDAVGDLDPLSHKHYSRYATRIGKCPDRQ